VKLKRIGSSTRYAQLLGVSDRAIMGLGGRPKLKVMPPDIRKLWLRQLLNTLKARKIA